MLENNVKKKRSIRDKFSQKPKFEGQTLNSRETNKKSVCIKYFELGCSVGFQNRGPRSTGGAAKQKNLD